MQAGKAPELEQLMSLLGEYEATGRDPAADGIPAELQVCPTLAVPPALLCLAPSLSKRTTAGPRDGFRLRKAAK